MAARGPLTAGALLIAALLAGAAPAQAQISPGPLSKPHERLEGVTSCTSCHELGKGVTQAKCLACHDEIAARVGAGRGYHASLAARGAGDCASCHREHVGRDFPLIEWPDGDRKMLPHADTGFPLEGAHAALDCARCHRPEGIRDPLVLAKKGAAGTLGRTFLGLDAACASCHADPHVGRFGLDCRSCHGEAAWRPVPRFDHARTDFPLLGAHARADCARCHEKGGAAPAPTTATAPAPATGPVKTAPERRFRGVPHAACTDCHADRHGGRLGRDCKSCHDEERWKPAAYAPARHAKLSLAGAHGRIDCARCHGERLERALAGATCATCHEDREHRGSLGRDCAACHGFEAFAPAAYDRAKHAPGVLPLAGRHATAACERCHVDAKAVAPATVAGRATRPPAACAACHADPHGPGRLGADCARCHGPDAFGPVASFGAAAHAATRYPLAGKHAAVRCSACHGARQGAPDRLARLAPLAHGRCRDCHADAHRGELARRPDGGACESCHDPGGFKPAHFDRREHAATAFPLGGAHAAVACAACHAAPRPAPAPAPPSGAASAAAAVRLRPAADRCGACHADPHRGQYGSLPAEGRCDACHGLERFRPAHAFDHSRTRFPLAGRHAAVGCDRCHGSAPSPGRAAAAPAAVSAACASCHADPHLGQFSRRGDPEPLGCADCHDPAAASFRPAARFDHARHARLPLEGRHAAIACAACHRRIELGPGLATTLYRPLPFDCAGCHVDQHDGRPWKEAKR